jgi:ADP-heptose:LPS heptosyltransferase
MGWKRNALEYTVRLRSLTAPRVAEPLREPRSILVLRNNDIGDLLVTTPLFEALRRTFPRTKIVAGIGSWNFDVLKNNPFIDEVLPVNAPWHNGRVKPQGLVPALRYIATSDELKKIAAAAFDIGIDVLGSGLGSFLLMQCRIPFRLGVRGYAGGHSAAQRTIAFDEREHVGRMALRFAELLGATELPENRPQIFLTETPPPNGFIVIAPGGGHAERRWPAENFAALAQLLAPEQIAVVGSAGDRAAADAIAAKNPAVTDFTGRQSLRETFSTIAACKLVVCNSSMAMHVAAAFRKPCCVLLGPYFASAAQHAAQWGHPETVVLGRSENHPGFFSAQEAMERIRAMPVAP